MVSVIIPCYNSGKYISRSIESVFNQTFKNFEIILVDNNSTDNTIDVLNDYLLKYPDKVRVFREAKQGAPATRNKGLLEAKGEWIQYLDSDDELLPGKFESQLEVAKDFNVDVIIAPSTRYKIFNGILRKIPRDIETKDFWKGLLTSTLGITSALLWKRASLLAVNGWDENLNSSQEYDLLFRLLKNNAVIRYCPLVQTIIHITDNSLSRTGNEDRMIEIMDNIMKLRREIKQYLQSKGMLTKELERASDIHGYTMIVMRTSDNPLIPLYFRKGKIPEFVKKTFKENQFDIPFKFKVKLHLNRVLVMLKARVKDLIKPVF